MRRRRYLAALLLGACVLAGLSCSGSGSHAGAERRQAPRHPPIVMLVFDEFSTISLLDARGGIDAVRYPNFAALARDSTWFPYASASLDETGRALRSLFTARTTWRYAKPDYADNPRNLFTLLGRRYRLRASEEASSLCPRRLCRSARRQTGRSILHKLATGRPERFERWLRTIRPSARPTFYFKHVLLPHAPWVFLPSGQRYHGGTSEAGLSWESWHFNRWLVNQDYQRHLLQVEFTDRLLGQALDRLRSTGLYERSLIVVTADNGESFGRLGNGHELNRRNAADIALTPLLVKLPFQRRGRVVRRHVRTVDVLPTIARVTHLRVDWRIDGRSLRGPAARQIPRTALLVKRSGHRLRLSEGDLHRRAAAALRLKLRLFGSGDSPPGLHGIGPYRFMHGTPVRRWRIRPPGELRASVDDAARYRSVGLGARVLPLKVTGRLSGSGSRGRTNLAIAMNGVIAATAPAVAPRRHARRVFSALLPKSALREGANRIEVFAIRPVGGTVELQPLTG